MVYDLCFGNFDHLTWKDNKIKFPSLISYFPLYAFFEEYSQIASLGNEQTILTPIRNKIQKQFEDIPLKFLIHPRYPG